LPGKYKTYSPEFRDEAVRLVVETSRAIADVAGRGAEGVVVRDARARSGPVLWFTPGGLCSGLWLCARMAGSSIGGAGGARSAPAASPGGLWGVMLPCCDDRRRAGAGGYRACARGRAVGWSRLGSGVAGVAGCVLVRVSAPRAAVSGGSRTGRDRLVTR